MNTEYRKLAVLGGGESGVGAAVLGKVKDLEVFLSDMGSIADKYKSLLREHHIQYEEGSHTASKILDADIIVKSPGIPDTAPIVAEAIRRGIPVVSEIEFAGKYTDSKMVCITGSNGKTTTTLLTYHILRRGGLDVGLAGNVGKSLALQVALDPHEVYVIELSSFQLDNMYDFKANVAVILNITPDHLDRYDHKMENYVAAKFRILQNQTPDDYFIYWLDDPIVSEQIRHVQSEAIQLPFSEAYQPGDAAWVEDGIVKFDIEGDIWDIPRDQLALPGLHNLYNSMAAGLSARLMKVRREDIREALSDFEAVEHRLEFVCEKDGVRWINDSKATNVNSTFYALESMNQPTVLILGGKDKGNDYSEIAELVEKKVKAIVAMGIDNTKIIDFFGGKVPVRDTHSLQDAVAACAEIAEAGDTVLLSPCCASFDLFKSYEDRGRQFKQEVLS
ncbi:MAG: UDP-N-acetylmuramoyl-L-alanine--D-glutamate ligase [Clostridium sp.]|nr:UDP-N-acetylmuramoyl-L-alanine--D-glutamate ligase [Prevotella sp.]MCM1429599.1 UDP-N-acetylmuramoyl-L-alanine--D-glutamate ligase [Clostridium sp.]MCM1476078.1 UDP-N-acetylmuramoyl-L-alanine--D-glutamate ligase [Muribaculaceae bacterium]